jgi:hypothetical protein
VTSRHAHASASPLKASTWPDQPILGAERTVAPTRELGQLRSRRTLALEAEFLSSLLVLSHAEIFTEGADCNRHHFV